MDLLNNDWFQALVATFGTLIISGIINHQQNKAGQTHALKLENIRIGEQRAERARAARHAQSDEQYEDIRAGYQQLTERFSWLKIQVRDIVEFYSPGMDTKKRDRIWQDPPFAEATPMIMASQIAAIKDDSLDEIWARLVGHWNAMATLHHSMQRKVVDAFTPGASKIPGSMKEGFDHSKFLEIQHDYIFTGGELLRRLNELRLAAIAQPV